MAVTLTECAFIAMSMRLKHFWYSGMMFVPCPKARERYHMAVCRRRRRLPVTSLPTYDVQRHAGFQEASE